MPWSVEEQLQAPTAAPQEQYLSLCKVVVEAGSRYLVGS